MKYLVKSYFQTPSGTVVDLEPYKEEVKPVIPKLKVALDAGHGGTDPGAVNAEWQEKHAALSIIELLRKECLARGWETLVTRPYDEYIGITRRAEMANEWGADLFISVHLNSAESKSASGIETLRYPTKNAKTICLADKVQKQLVKATGFKNRGVKERADLGVLRLTRMPAILCEVGFISNDEEASTLFTHSCQLSIAEAIIKGVEECYV